MVDSPSKPDERALVYPEDRLPLHRLLPLGLQHVVAMFGATVLAPILMGFDPQVALFFSGIGTLIFVLVTGGRVPSYLGSSFAFIGPVLAITGGDAKRIPEALFGIAAAALLYGAAALVTMRVGSRWIDRLMPPIVTGTVVALIGLNLAGSSVSHALGPALRVTTSAEALRLAVACCTFLVAAACAVYLRGFLRLIPILLGVLAGSALAAAVGLIDAAAVARIGQAAWIGLPPFQLPQPSLPAVAVIAPVVVVLLAENKGHIAAIGGYLDRDLDPWLGRAYLGDALASFVSALGGGTPQTTYAENMGVMAITRVFATGNFVIAALVALLLGVCPKFGAIIQAIPQPVLGGVTLLLYGLITLMGVKIWLDAKLDFADQRNLLVAGIPLILATGLGVKGLTIGNVNVAGIALGTVLALVLQLLFGARQTSEDDQ
jgi:putative pyrimidine permease RutG